MKHNHANQSMGVSYLPRRYRNQLIGNNVPWTTCKNVIQGPLDMLPLRSKKGTKMIARCGHIRRGAV